MWVCDMILGPPSSRVYLADWLEEAVDQLWMEQAARQEADAKLEALWSIATRVQDLVLERVDRTCSLATALSSVVELLGGHIDTATANGVHWCTRSALTVALSHFPELGTEHELLGSRRNADLMKDQVDALWTQAR
jgi:hypothetical protein